MSTSSRPSRLLPSPSTVVMSRGPLARYCVLSCGGRRPAGKSGALRLGCEAGSELTTVDFDGGGAGGGDFGGDSASPEVCPFESADGGAAGSVSGRSGSFSLAEARPP